jgi:hypothetical protein
VVLESSILQEGFRYLGKHVKGVGEYRRIGHVAVSETWIVGRDYVKARGEFDGMTGPETLKLRCDPSSRMEGS